MGRRKGFDSRKIVAILTVLARNPDGIWLRKIAQEAHLHPTTVSNYIGGVFQPLIDDVSLGGSGKALLRVIKLKPYVLQKLEQGLTVSQILKILGIIKDLE